MTKKELIKILKNDKNINTIKKYEKNITIKEYIKEQADYYNLNLNDNDLKQIIKEVIKWLKLQLKRIQIKILQG